MSRLDRETEVIELARALGLSGSPVQVIVDFCRSRIDGWTAENGGVETIAQLEALVCDRLQLVHREIWSDEELDETIRQYLALGEKAFAALKMLLDGETFGSLLERRHIGGDARDRYVAFIDCRGEKAARRFFTRWHEIAHVMTRTRRVELPVRRSERHPLERLMDEIAGQIAFFDLLFAPVLTQHYRAGRLSLAAVDRIREAYAPEASFQATLFACQRRIARPILYLEAGLGLRAAEERFRDWGLDSILEIDPPEEKLRVKMIVPNAEARRRKLGIVGNMRIPASSVIHRLFSGQEEELSGTENLGAWEFSNGAALPECEVWVEARRLLPDRVLAIVQPD